MPQLLLALATPILYRQLLRQRGHDLLPVFSSRSSQDIIKNAATNLPVQQSEFRVHCGSRAGTGTIDKLSDVVEQGAESQVIIRRSQRSARDGDGPRGTLP